MKKGIKLFYWQTNTLSVAQSNIDAWFLEMNDVKDFELNDVTTTKTHNGMLITVTYRYL